MIYKMAMTFLMVFVLLAGNCYAMQFSGLTKLGYICGNPIGGFSIDGANQNKGSVFKRAGMDLRQWGILYEKGIAQFGNKNNALWIYYDCSNARAKDYWDAYSPKFGNKEKTVTVSLGAGEGDTVDIFRINNNENRALYFLAHNGCVVGAEVYVIMGYDKNGKFVKYIDTTDVVNNYLGKRNFGMKGMFFGKYYCRGNSIIVEYMDPRVSHDFKNPAGEFRFKWDDKAQWFGVEQVVY